MSNRGVLILSTKDGWCVSLDRNGEYLHTDGVARQTTYNPATKSYSGYFPSEAAALAALTAYRASQKTEAANG